MLNYSGVMYKEPSDTTKFQHNFHKWHQFFQILHVIEIVNFFTIKAIPNPNLSFILRVDWSKATTAAAAHGFLQHNFIDKGSRRQRNFALLLVKTCSKDYNTFWIMVKGQKAWKQIFNSATNK